MNKFNKLSVPAGWKEEWTEYPHGYTIFEALCSWTKQVDDMVDNVNDWNDYLDNFVENFEFELQEEVKNTLTRWQDEGLLTTIINEALQTKVDEAIDTIEARKTFIALDEYKELFVDNDVTEALKQAISDIDVGGEIIFNNARTHIISQTISIAKPVTINFNNATIEIRVGGTHVFELLHVGIEDFRQRIELINYNFTVNPAFVPSKIIYINGAINSLLKGSFDMGCKCSHSMIHNEKGYGTKIFGESRYVQAPRVIYLSHSNEATHSFDFYIDMDITGNSVGGGVEAEGGAGEIHGVIENCKFGYLYNGIAISVGISISVHFEANHEYDMQIGTDSDNAGGTKNTGLTTIIGSFFSPSQAPEKSVIFGRYQNINVIHTWLSKPLVPLSFETTSDTSISVFGGHVSGNRRPVAEEHTGRRNIWLTCVTPWNVELNSPNVTGDMSVSGNLTLGGGLYGNRVLYPTDQSFSIYEAGVGSAAVSISRTRIAPSHLATDLGGQWNKFNNVYAKDYFATSPDGATWRISVNNSGEISTTKI